MAVAGVKPGDTYVKTTRGSIVPESATLAYTPAELAAISARRSSQVYYTGQTFQPGTQYYQPGGFGTTTDPTGGSYLGVPCFIYQAFGYTCDAAGAAKAIADGVNLARGGGGTSGGGTGFADTPGAAASCPDGYIVNPSTGICEKIGMGGAIQRTLPGGQTGTLSDIYGEAVVGAFGTPALVPAQVGTITRRDGTTGSVLRCPPGAVLGKDSLCYMKGSIPKQFRKWRPPSGRCPISKKDWAAIKSIGRVQKTIRKVASEAGMTAKKR